MPYEPLIFLLIAVLVILLVLWWRERRKFEVESVYDVDGLIDAFGEDNIMSVAYERGKIVVDVQDVRSVDLQAIKSYGAEGVNAVGNKVKFYFKEDTQTLFDSLDERLKTRKDEAE